MSKQDLLRTPHHPQKRDDVWWYEENDGIYVVMESAHPTTVKGHVANTCHIKWSSLRAALRRRDKKDPDKLAVKNQNQPIEIVECDACRAKPGSPTLCGGCLINRRMAERAGIPFNTYPTTHD